MTPLPRGTCPVCGRDVALRTNGKTREHRGKIHEPYLCRGSGMVRLGPPLAGRKVATS